MDADYFFWLLFFILLYECLHGLDPRRVEDALFRLFSHQLDSSCVWLGLILAILVLDLLQVVVDHLLGE